MQQELLGVSDGIRTRAAGITTDVVVGAETAGVPLAAATALAAGLPFAFARKPGYRGHEINEPPVRGADVAGRRVLLVDDAVSSGAAVERFTASLASVGAEVAGVFVLVDMREVAETVPALVWDAGPRVWWPGGPAPLADSSLSDQARSPSPGAEAVRSPR
jgi:orotate phosphoribosyltransferase